MLPTSWEYHGVMGITLMKYLDEFRDRAAALACGLSWLVCF